MSTTPPAVPPLRSVCVYCGSNSGTSDAYVKAAVRFGQTLAERGLRLVYGGGSVGLMGTVADAVMAAGGEVIGVIPQALVDRELAHNGLTELIVTGSMHERKSRMADLADGFVAMPGGIGTLEEIFEVWTWSQLGLHAKPCALYNVDGYYDSLIQFLDHTVTQGFVRGPYRDLLVTGTDPGVVLDKMANYTPPTVGKWIERDQT